MKIILCFGGSPHVRIVLKGHNIMEFENHWGRRTTLYTQLCIYIDTWQGRLAFFSLSLLSFFSSHAGIFSSANIWEINSLCRICWNCWAWELRLWGCAVCYVCPPHADACAGSRKSTLRDPFYLHLPHSFGTGSSLSLEAHWPSFSVLHSTTVIDKHMTTANFSHEG